MKVLITGGCGFIGSHLVEHHLAQGDDVWVVDDLSTGLESNIINLPNAKNITLDKNDINDWPNIDKAVKWADRIYHMAAVVGVFHVLSNPVKLFKTNINGTEILLQALIRNNVSPRLMVTSSSSVYGHSDKTALSENDNLILLANSHPLRGYAVSKIVDEVITSSYAKIYNFRYTLMRLFNTVGPRQRGQYGMVVPRFVQQACLNEPITIFGTGDQTRSFCDVRDSIAMITKLANTEDAIGETVNIGRDVATSINDLAALVKDKAKSSSELTHVDYSAAYGQVLSDIAQRRPDISKVKILTHYEHQWPLDKTVENLIMLFRSKEGS